MLKPENIKQIEDLLAEAFEKQRDNNVKRLPYNHLADSLASAVEDLLIERNCVILPAFKQFIVDTKSCLLQPGEEEEIMNNCFKEQWETFM